MNRVKSCAKLLFESRPAYRSDALESVKPVAKPCVQIKSHAIIANCPHGGLVQWHGVGVELFEKQLRELGYLREQVTLARRLIKVSKYGLIENGHSANGARFYTFAVERKATSAYALSLVLDRVDGLSAQRYAHSEQPLIHGSPETNFPAVRAQSFALHVKHY